MNPKARLLIGLGALVGVGALVVRRASAAPAGSSTSQLPEPAKAAAAAAIKQEDPNPPRGRSQLEQAAEELDQHLRANPRKGSESKAMVAAFQTAAGDLKVDGLYGPKTRARLETVLNRKAPAARYFPRKAAK